MSRKVKFTKQYNPIKFGDGSEPGTVEGHRNAMARLRTRKYNRRMKELAAEDAAKRAGLLSKVRFLSFKLRRY